MAVFDFLHLGSTMSLRSYSRLASALSLYGVARFGSSLAILGSWNLGASLSVRSASVRLGSCLSISGTEGVSDIPMEAFKPLSVKSFVQLGSSISVCGISRMGAALSVLDFTHLGASLSLRGSLRLGSTVSVLGFAALGSSLSLRSFSRMSASLSILGNVRFGATMSVIGKMEIQSDKIVQFPEWTLNWDAGNSKLKLTKDGVVKSPLVMSSTGGDLHGVWTLESILSASDRRLKHDILPLANTLQEKSSAKFSTQMPTASRLLQALNPMRFVGVTSSSTVEDLDRRKDGGIRFDSDEVEKVLPELVRPTHQTAPTDIVRKGVLYQDFIAILTLAAQERQRKLEEHQAREAEEILLIRQQEAMIDALETQVKSLNGRFTRLRSRSPTPPRWD